VSVRNLTANEFSVKSEEQQSRSEEIPLKAPLTEFLLWVRTSPNRYVAFARIHAGAKAMPANHQDGGRHGEVRMRIRNDVPKASDNIQSEERLPRTSDEGERTQGAEERARIVGYEFIDCGELARRWDVPVSWIRDQVRKRAEDPLPHVNLGKYVRFLWGSPELQAWVERRIVMGNNRRVGRVH